MKISRFFSIFLTIIGLLSLLIGTSVTTVQGEAALKFKNVQLWVNPEYDNTQLLVMMQGQLDGIQAPVTISFLVPTAAQMYSAGSIDASGKYSGGPPNRVSSSVTGWDTISYTLTTDTFRIEYYDDIIIGQPNKTIAYEFRWLSPISNLSVAIQQPKRSNNFAVTPAGQVSQDYQSFTIQSYSYSNLDTQPPLQFNISYTKTDSNPSITQTAPTAPTSSTSSGNIDPSTLAITIIIVLVVIITVVLWVRGRTKKKNRAVRRQATRTSTKKTAVHKESGKQTCPECGEPTDSNKFCPSCGAKL